MFSSGQLTRPVHVPPMRSFAAHRDTRPGAPRDGPPQDPGGCRELAEISSRRDARHRRLARRVWPPRVHAQGHARDHRRGDHGHDQAASHDHVADDPDDRPASSGACDARGAASRPAPPRPRAAACASCVRRAELPRGGARAASCAAACADICPSVMCLPGRSCSGGAGGLGTRMRRRAAAAAATSAARVAGHMRAANMLREVGQ